MSVKGKVVWVSGPAVKASGMTGAKMYEMVEVGEEKLIGEIIKLSGDTAFIQVYESTSGIRPGEPVIGTGKPLSVTLGPGIVGTIYDGLQRPLPAIASISGSFISRGIKASPIPLDKEWKFIPTIKRGEKLEPGSIIGYVEETPLIKHCIMVPPNYKGGAVTSVEPEGKYKVEDVVAVLSKGDEKEEVRLYHTWPVRKRRPYKQRLDPEVPLITGQRVLDTFFPLAKGGTAAIPGGFGTGKTVTLHQIASWADAKVVVYVGCGERGNEMTEVLIKFPELKDPYSGRPLMERTILLANTSNMPVAAREASIYTGITLAEYYRDMGYDVVMLADSTSRWAEALREISGRMEEMPAEEGYPSYLASKLAEFYERAGRVETIGKPSRVGSVSLIGAVSPPGADFTEPVTTHTLRFIRTFWALDTRLAYSRHYPAINWMTSYSGYLEYVKKWWIEKVSSEWPILREKAYHILQREDALREIVRLLGPEILPEEEKLILEVARMIKIGFLQQSAYDPIDTYTSPKRQVLLLKLFVEFYERAEEALRRGVPLDKIKTMPIIQKLLRAKFEIPEDQLDKLEALRLEVEESFKALIEEVKVHVS